MGQFSWLDCCSHEQILDDYKRDVYVLVPLKFQNKYGAHIVEHCYDGYGEFGDYDIYDLVAEWNRDMIPEIIRRIKNNNWKCETSDDDIELLNAYYNGQPIPEGSEARYVGIIMGCYDKDNAALEYPIKITYDKHALYEYCDPSPSDPDQGWAP